MSIISTIIINSNVTVVFDKGNSGKRCFVSVFVKDFTLLTEADYVLFTSGLGAYRVLNPSVEAVMLKGRMTLDFLRSTTV